jgi:hypothetical protein
MITITHKTVNGFSIRLLNNGHVAFCRDAHDSLPEMFQGKKFFCKNIKEFESVCSYFEGK